MIKAIYAGSFDPITIGHMDIINRAAKLFHLTIGVANNPKKNHWLKIEERQDLIAQSIVDVTRQYHVQVFEVSGLLAKFCKANGIQVLIRGLRNTIDFEYELGMSTVNAGLGDLETVFLPANPGISHISSSLVRELASLGEDVSSYVPKGALSALKELGKVK